jgi:hypothetical protein
LLAVDGKKAAYFGGTVSAFAGAEDPVEGRLDTVNEEALILTAEKKPYVGQTSSGRRCRSFKRDRARRLSIRMRRRERRAEDRIAPAPTIFEAAIPLGGCGLSVSF